MTEKEACLRAARYAVVEYLRLCKKRPTGFMSTTTNGSNLVSAKIVSYDDVLICLSELIEEEAKRK